MSRNGRVKGRPVPVPLGPSRRTVKHIAHETHIQGREMRPTEFRQQFEMSVTLRRKAIFSARKAVADLDLIGSGAAFTPHNELAFDALYLPFRARTNVRARRIA